MALSIKKRWEIFFLSKHPRGPKMNITQIGKELRCARAAVRTWLQRYEETGDVQDKEGRGRNRKTTERQDNMIGALMEQDTEQSAAGISEILQTKGVDISPTTVRQRLKEQGWKFKMPLAKPLLKEDHRTNRLRWARTMLDQDWDKVIFTDEATFQLYANPLKEMDPLKARDSVQESQAST